MVHLEGTTGMGVSKYTPLADRSYLYISLLIVSSLSLILCSNKPAFSSGKTIDSGAKIGYTITVTTPSHTPEIYNTSAGLVQWQAGLPVPIQDTIQVTAVVASGNASIKHISVKLDNVALPSIPTAPWVETLVGGSLSVGSHVLTLSTQLDDRHRSVAVFPMTFNSVQALPVNLAPPAAPVVSSVKGAQQLLSQGSVASIDPALAGAAPPIVGATGKQVSGAGLDVTFASAAAVDQRNSGVPVVVDDSIVAILVPMSGSNVDKFVFAIYRDGNIVYSSNSVNAAAGAGIKIQVQNQSHSGLLPGVVQLLLWGVNGDGNYTAPTIVSFDIKNSQQPLQTKL